MLVKPNRTTYLDCMDGYLTAEQLAARLGIQRASIYRMRTRGDLPEPDERVGRTPLWAAATIDEWTKDRPGHGWRKGKSRDSGKSNDDG